MWWFFYIIQFFWFPNVWKWTVMVIVTLRLHILITQFGSILSWIHILASSMHTSKTISLIYQNFYHVDRSSKNFSSSDTFMKKLTPGGYSNYFLTGCAARGLKPLPISKDFSPSKNGWFKAFFRNFRKSEPISKGFSTSKWLILPFFCDFREMGPSSKDFFDQNRTHV